jgi:hypothetical protein
MSDGLAFGGDRLLIFVMRRQRAGEILNTAQSWHFTD